MDSSGSPLYGKEVTIEKKGWIVGGFYPSERTDSTGQARFSLDGLSSTNQIAVHCAGSKRYEGYPKAELTCVVR